MKTLHEVSVDSLTLRYLRFRFPNHMWRESNGAIEYKYAGEPTWNQLSPRSTADYARDARRWRPR